MIAELESAQPDRENQRYAELVYPVEFNIPDGTTASFSSREEIGTALAECENVSVKWTDLY